MDRDSMMAVMISSEELDTLKQQASDRAEIIYKLNRQIEELLVQKEQFLKLKELTRNLSKRVIAQADLAFKYQDLEHTAKLVQKQRDDQVDVISAFNNQITEMERETTAYKLTLQQKDNTYLRETKKNAEHQNLISNLYAQINALGKQLSGKEATIKEQDQIISDVRSENTQKESTIQTLKQQIIDLNNELIHKNSIINHQENVLLTNIKESKEKEMSIQSLKDSIQNLKKQLNQKDIIIQNKDSTYLSEITLKEKETAALKLQLNSTKTFLEQLNQQNVLVSKQLQEKHAQILQLINSLTAKDQQIASLNDREAKATFDTAQTVKTNTEALLKAQRQKQCLNLRRNELKQKYDALKKQNNELIVDSLHYETKYIELQNQFNQLLMKIEQEQ